MCLRQFGPCLRYVTFRFAILVLSRIKHHQSLSTFLDGDGVTFASEYHVHECAVASFGMHSLTHVSFRDLLLNISTYQPPDGQHCPDCNVCIEGYDHHCVWMGTCIGKKNYRQFIRFNLSWLLYLIFAISWVYVLGPAMYNKH